MSDAQSRANTAQALETEAREVLERLDLLGLLAARFGEVATTGSLSYGLMVWRDMDIHMPVAPEARLDWVRFGLELAQHMEAVGMRLHKGHYLDDYVDPHPLGAGLYWGIEFRDHQDRAWKADLWGWAPDDFVRRCARDEALMADLARADSDLILRLKTEARARPDYYGRIVTSFDVYGFAIARAGESLDELEAWVAEQR
ncbi:hypothetical protein [Devosia nitrariae]|uniref:Uncharacterized protein n=1 Tax=Devosia nitrariae TaxID=2071872 RepID=A0ABQ5W3L6_9HYPH|nr:hypothetical protein [Devosia nitrariae]GLQ54404.1 hypothetical protein GCM10010862_16630 [Devosia nitrariae]